jgi:pre-mRNA-splicing factor 18
MDFASLMAKEISKANGSSTASPSKPHTQSSHSPSSKSTSTPTPAPKESKYVRRGDLEAARISAYQAEQEQRERERLERAAQKRKLEEEEAERRREREDKKRRLAEESRKRREAEEEARERERRKRLGLPESSAKRINPADGSKEGTPVEGDDEEIEDEELIAKLRELGEPARLFAESHKHRLRRYYRRLRKTQQANQIKKLSDGPIPTTLELLPEKEMRVPPKPPKDREGRVYLFRQLASYFTMVLKEWERALDKRDLSVQQSFHGKQAYNAMVQARENMKPLFTKFEQGDIDNSVLEAIVEIVNYAQDRRYVDANDGYLRLSIGKAYVLRFLSFPVALLLVVVVLIGS